jgi:hypothetical protein
MPSDIIYRVERWEKRNKEIGSNSYDLSVIKVLSYFLFGIFLFSNSNIEKNWCNINHKSY